MLPLAFSIRWLGFQFAFWEGLQNDLKITVSWLFNLHVFASQMKLTFGVWLFLVSSGV